MIRLEDVHLFVRTAALGSFSNAAREADTLPGQVSAAVHRLERELDKRLFARSTRSLRLTPEGEKYLPYAQEMLSVVQAGADVLQESEHELRGDLNIAVPSDTGRNVLLAPITDFCARHPNVSLRLFLSDQISDIFRAQVDIAIRFGALMNNSYLALPLAASNRRIMAASPAYLDKYGRPETLEALQQHRCVLYMINGHAADKWSFTEGGVARQIVVKSQMLTDDADVARRWAVEGMGIVCKSWIDLAADVEAGRLEVVLPQVQGDVVPLNLVCPHRKQLSPAVRALHAELRTCLESIVARMPGSNGVSG